jgi:hypothetical protein
VEISLIVAKYTRDSKKVKASAINLGSVEKDYACKQNETSLTS